MTARHEKHKCA